MEEKTRGRVFKEFREVKQMPLWKVKVLTHVIDFFIIAQENY